MVGPHIPARELAARPLFKLDRPRWRDDAFPLADQLLGATQKIGEPNFGAAGICLRGLESWGG